MKQWLTLTEARTIAEATINNGGYSHVEYQTGYMVSLEGSERVIFLSDNDLDSIAKQIQDFYEEHKTVNTWLDEDAIYLDVSIHFEDLEIAKMIADLEHQRAIYDCKNKKSIYI